MCVWESLILVKYISMVIPDWGQNLNTNELYNCSCLFLNSCASLSHNREEYIWCPKYIRGGKPQQMAFTI